MKNLLKLTFGLAALVMSSHALSAATAANAVLENTATVNYQNAALDSFSNSSTASVTINLVPQTPLLNLVGTSTFTDIQEGQVIGSVTYYATSQSNGPDTYEYYSYETATTELTATNTDITSGPALDSLIGDGVAGAVTSAAFTDLGASVAGTAVDIVATDCIVGGAGTCHIELPNDTGASDGIVNGLDTGDRVLIATTTGSDVYCDITADQDAGLDTPYVPGNDDSFIEVDNCSTDYAGTTAPGSAATVVGDAIYEVQEITIDYTMGTLATLADETVTVTLEIDVTGTGADDAGDATEVEITITVIDNIIIIYKFVRNISTANAGDTGNGPGTVLDLNGNGDNTALFYASGVDADPGEYLEYAIVLFNRGSTDATSVVITDPAVPFTDYIDLAHANTPPNAGEGTEKGLRMYPSVTLTSNDCDTNADECEVTGLGALVVNADDTLATASDLGGETGGGVITIYAGNTGRDEATAAATLEAGEVTISFYTLQVD